MSIVLSLSTLAVRYLVDGACKAVGITKQGEAVAKFLTERFTDHSQRLTKALATANENAWKALEIALAGDSFWERCKVAVARSEDKAFAQQVRAFLDATPLLELVGKDQFRQKCLEELRSARKAGTLAGTTLEPRLLAQRSADFARFADPKSLLDAEWQLVVGMAGELKDAGYPSLGWLISQRPHHGTPILVAGVRYFFRRSVEEDQKLFQGLAFAKLEALNDAQEKGFAALTTVLVGQGQRLEELLGDVKAVVVQTHSAVLDLQGQMKGQGEQIQQIGQAVLKLLDQHQLQRRQLRPADSMSIRNEGERKIVKQLIERYRALPEKDRQGLPALLNAVGKLEVVSGNFDAAQKDFQHVATLVADNSAQAEAHFNAYQTALERRDWTTALKELLHAVKLDAKRFAPFPVGKYHPQRILGAGGFGVAFSCRHKELKADVVVKILTSDDLDRDVDEVFNEARVLYQLEHPAIIRLLDCGYTIPAEKARPYFVMNFFESVTLEEYVQKNGPLPPEDMIVVARQLAEGLQAAHSKGILHRDVKPANILVRKDDSGWQVKIIDFGLALKQKVIEGAASTSKQNRTLTGSSIAGTLDYAAPEQMGRSPGVAVGPYSDIYGWAKTCCYALFQTTQPLSKHWKSLPESLAELLEGCLAEIPKERPQAFAQVLIRLAKGTVCISAPLATPLPKQRKAEKSTQVPMTEASPQRRPRRGLWVFLGAVVCLLIVVGIAVLLFGGWGQKESGEANKVPGQNNASAWQLIGIKRFAERGNNTLLDDPRIVDELGGDTSGSMPKIQGIKQLSDHDTRLLGTNHWFFGKAFVWNVANKRELTANISIYDQASGPNQESRDGTQLNPVLYTLAVYRGDGVFDPDMQKGYSGILLGKTRFFLPSTGQHTLSLKMDSAASTLSFLLDDKRVSLATATPFARWNLLLKEETDKRELDSSIRSNDEPPFLVVLGVTVLYRNERADTSVKVVPSQ